MGRGSPEGGNLCSLRPAQSGGSKPARSDEERNGVELFQKASPGLRARPPVIVPSKIAYVNIDDDYVKKDSATRYEVVGRTCVSHYMGKSTR